MSLVRMFTRLFQRKKKGTTTRDDEKISSNFSSTDSGLSVYVNLPRNFVGSTKANRPPTSNGQSATPYAIYDGGFVDAQKRGVCIRIANGGAGQAGLIKAWADAFITVMVARGSEPFQVNLILHVKDMGGLLISV